MLKLTAILMGALIGVGAGATPAAAQILGPDAAACREGTSAPAVLVHVSGFKQRTGTLRVQIYGSNPGDFLVKGKKLRRVDLPVVPSGAMDVCVALPAIGQYAVAVRHDLDGNGKSGWNDGGGFSRNPSISLFDLKPRYNEVAITVAEEVKPVQVILNYRQGITIRPISMAGR